jgi:hypothetical protein
MMPEFSTYQTGEVGMGGGECTDMFNPVTGQTEQRQQTMEMAKNALAQKALKRASITGQYQTKIMADNFQLGK